MTYTTPGIDRSGRPCFRSRRPTSGRSISAIAPTDDQPAWSRDRRAVRPSPRPQPAAPAVLERYAGLAAQPTQLVDAGIGVTSSTSALEIASLTDDAGHIALLHGAVGVGAGHDHLTVRRSAAWTSSRGRYSITV